MLYYLVDFNKIAGECTQREFLAFVEGKEGRDKYDYGFTKDASGEVIFSDVYERVYKMKKQKRGYNGKKNKTKKSNY